MYELLAGNQEIQKTDKDMHMRRLTLLKAACVKNLCVLLGFESQKDFKNVFRSESTSDADKKYVVHALGIDGGVSAGSPVALSMNYDDWKGAEASQNPQSQEDQDGLPLQPKLSLLLISRSDIRWMQTCS